MARKLRRLTPADCWGLGMSYLYLVWAGGRILLCREKIDRWLKGGLDAAGGTPATVSEWNVMTRRARWVNAAARYPLPWARCLQRSLALCTWLDRSGLRPVLKIGVRLDGGALSAHAWVERDGRVVNDTPIAVGEFVVLEGSDPQSPGGRLDREGRWI